MEPVARKVLGSAFSEERLLQAVEEGYSAQEKFRALVREKSRQIMEELDGYRDLVCAVFVGSLIQFTMILTRFMICPAEGLAIPQDFARISGGKKGEISSGADRFRDEFNDKLQNL